MYKNKKNKRRGLLAVLLIVLGTILLCQNLYYRNLESPVDAKNNTKISFFIKKGETAKNVGENLKKQKLIKSKIVFGIYSRNKNLAEKIIAGRFLLQKSMTIPQILKIITDPAQAESVITIQEGLTARDIDKKLVEMGLIEKGKFIEAVKKFDGYEAYPFLDQEALSKLEIPLEGYLFPDTYFLNGADFKPEQLIIKCLNNFSKKIPQKPKNLHEIITMASIIELETNTAEDRPIVSGILWKRYRNNWHLGADATLLYVTGDREISKKDLEIDSPYNTRKVVGIPPGPISNPGMASIKAAIEPAESPYWYYLTTPDTGKVIYAKTNTEHNVNKAKYLKLRL